MSTVRNKDLIFLSHRLKSNGVVEGQRTSSRKTQSTRILKIKDRNYGVTSHSGHSQCLNIIITNVTMIFMPNNLRMSHRQILSLLSNSGSVGSVTSIHKLCITSPNKFIFIFSCSNSTQSPAATYDNVELHKDRILKENKDKSGVYRLTNLDGGGVKLGS